MTTKFRPNPGGAQSFLNITEPTLIFLGEGLIFKVSIIVTPTAAGGVYDSATVAGAAQSNQLAAIPAGTLGFLDFQGSPFFTGLVVNPGTGGVLTVFCSPNYASASLSIAN
ncbi:hypothetical protein [Acidithiobacillus sp.]|uniref:hypothetical protein n=1 Tax=Acidithiobacillus sp. TaxID=1872118 RepID=UPI003D04A598